MRIARLNDFLEKFDQESVEEAKSLGADILSSATDPGWEKPSDSLVAIDYRSHYYRSTASRTGSPKSKNIDETRSERARRKASRSDH